LKKCFPNVQLKLQGSKAVNVWKKKHANKRFFVKVTTINSRMSKGVSD
jgi:hypothetical protein